MKKLGNKVCIKDADRTFLEVMAISLARDIDRGREDLRGLLEEVFAALPDAPEYHIQHRRMYR